MQKLQCTTILTAPKSPRQHYYPHFLKLLIANPIQLLCSQTLLTQCKGLVSHPNPESLHQIAGCYRQSLVSEGFSRKTRKLLSKSWRKITQKDYRSKFKQFNSWCREREVDPYFASLGNGADLTHLFEKGLNYRTINGYTCVHLCYLQF